MSIDHEIASRVEAVRADESIIGAFSTGETIAIALVLDRPDLLPPGYSKILQAIDRLGPEWLQAAIRVQKSGA